MLQFIKDLVRLPFYFSSLNNGKIRKKNKKGKVIHVIELDATPVEVKAALGYKRWQLRKALTISAMITLLISFPMLWLLYYA